MDSTRIGLVAAALKKQIYTETYGGKSRGKFLLSRESLKELLGLSRLSQALIEELTTQCLNIGLTVIDMDDSFAFAEKRFVRNWRKAPNILIQQITELIDKEMGVQVDFDEEFEEEDLEDPQTIKKTPPRRIKRSV